MLEHVETTNSGIEHQRRGEAEGIIGGKNQNQTNSKTKGSQERKKKKEDKAGRSQESGLRDQYQDQMDW